MKTTSRKLIGKGSFTKAYLLNDGTVEVESICPAKECYALFSKGNSFAPIIDRTDYLDSGVCVYKMPLYPKCRAPKRELNTTAYKVYTELRKLSCQFAMTYNKFTAAVEALSLEEDTKEEIISLAGDVANAIDCNDMGFEISPRNISYTAEGGLVMLDCFFSRKLLHSIAQAKQFIDSLRKAGYIVSKAKKQKPVTQADLDELFNELEGI
jgi:hypothetical protein